MQLKIKSQEDFWAGMLFIGFGLLAVIVSRDYPMGSAMRMGPGYFPTWLGIIMIVFGAILSARALWVKGEGAGRWSFRPVVFLSVAFMVYGLFMEQFELGFVPAVVALIFLSALAGREFKVVETILLAVVLVAMGVGIFIYGIELPYPLFWWR